MDVVKPWHYVDTTARENERKWSVEPAIDGGLLIRAYDDEGAEFDRVTLRRWGAFVLLDFGRLAPPLPASLEFLRPAIEATRRMKSIGLPPLAAPLLVHSSHIKRALELGTAPLLSAYRPRGAWVLFGLRIVWDEALDEHAPSVSPRGSLGDR